MCSQEGIQKGHASRKLNLNPLQKSEISQVRGVAIAGGELRLRQRPVNPACSIACLWLAGNEGMEKTMEITILGNQGTTTKTYVRFVDKAKSCLCQRFSLLLYLCVSAWLGVWWVKDV